MKPYDVIIIGAGAAGMFCAIEAARRGRRVLLLDHAHKIGEKIRISGGGRCNFTNLYVDGSQYLSQNPKFALSALKRYTQWDFIDRVAQAGIAYHEKTLGQLFCDGSAQQIIDMLISDMNNAGVDLRMGQVVSQLSYVDAQYHVVTDGGTFSAPSLVVATGGKSIPKIGATGFGYQIARQFGLTLVETRPGLVPLTFEGDEKSWMADLSGLSAPARLSCAQTSFEEGVLMTHRGLSGPSVLQISSYWREGEESELRFFPDQNLCAALIAQRQIKGGILLKTALGKYMPDRLAELMVAKSGLSGNLADQSDEALAHLVAPITLLPSGTEGYRTAEVTLGGVSTDELDAKTMEAKRQKGLYFIGEVVDVTGWLGGYNFQWAWSSGWAAGQVC